MNIMKIIMNKISFDLNNLVLWLLRNDENIIEKFIH